MMEKLMVLILHDNSGDDVEEELDEETGDKTFLKMAQLLISLVGVMIYWCYCYLSC